MSQTPVEDRRIGALLVAALMLTFAPALAGSYGVSDDYAALLRFAPGGDAGAVSEDRGVLFAYGRPALFPLLKLSYGSLHRIDDLRCLRGLAVLCIGALAWALWRALVRSGWPRLRSACAALVVCTTPPFQVYAAWAIEAFFPLAALISGAACAAAGRALEARRPGPRAALAGGAVALQTLALTLFQPAAMFFWVFAAVAIFRPGVTLRELGRSLAAYGAVLGPALGLAFAVYRVGQHWYGAMGAAQRSQLASDLWGKASWFVEAPLQDALNLSSFPSSFPVAVVVGGLVVLGLLRYFPGSPAERAARTLVALAILPVCYLPNLVTAESWSAYRTQAALTSVLVVYAFLALQGLLARRVRPALLTAGLALAALAACLVASARVVTYYVVPQSIELALMREQLRGLDPAVVQTLTIRQASWSDAIAPLVRYDEFGFPSTAASFALRPMAALLLRERGVDHRRLRIEVIPPEAELDSAPAGAVVDMRRLAAFR